MNRFPVVAVLDRSVPTRGTVLIDRDAGLFMVRPYRRARVYTLPLSIVASIVVSKIVKAEVAEKRRAKKARRAGRLAVLVLCLIAPFASAGSLYDAAAQAGERVDMLRGDLFPMPKPYPFAMYREAFFVDAGFVVAGAAAAIGTTEAGLASCAACREGNPLVHSLRDRVIMRSLFLAARVVASRHLRRQGKNRAANVARYLGAAFDIADSVHNVKTARGNR